MVGVAKKSLRVAGGFAGNVEGASLRPDGLGACNGSAHDSKGSEGVQDHSRGSGKKDRMRNRPAPLIRSSIDGLVGRRRQPGAWRANNLLVLTRKSNQSIMIGDDIEVSVLSIMGEKVRIGIQAPRNIPVFRKEVYLEIQQEKASGGRAEVEEALENLSTEDRS